MNSEFSKLFRKFINISAASQHIRIKRKGREDMIVNRDAIVWSSSDNEIAMQHWAAVHNMRVVTVAIFNTESHGVIKINILHCA